VSRVGARTTLAVLALVVLASLLPVLAATAQTPRIYRIGAVLLGGPYAAALQGLREGLREQGFEEAKQYTLILRDTKGDTKVVETVARELERDNVDLLYTVATSVTLSAKRATTRVPIVFNAGSDPIALGLVESYRKPGGRLTGVHSQLADLTAKRLELLKEVVPGVRRVLVLSTPENPVSQQALKSAREAAHQLKIELVERPVRSTEELRAALTAVRPGEFGALFYIASALVTSQTDAIIEIARQKKLPTMFQEPDSINKGALAAYGSSYRAAGHLSAKHVRRVLQGTPPGEIPVEQVSKPYLALNLKTAKAIGLTVPHPVVMRADEIIQ
jgi:putative ABC transport system substrate-binding protein